jgi:hypothetical protein
MNADQFFKLAVNLTTADAKRVRSEDSLLSRLDRAHERLRIAEREADLAQRRVTDAEVAVQVIEQEIVSMQRRRKSDANG